MSSVSENIEQHIPYLRNFARALTRNVVAADDLLQECLTRGLLKQHLFTEGTNLRAWLTTIMHNLHVNELRRRGRAEILFDPSELPTSVVAEPNQENYMMLRAAERALQMMPDKQRLALELVKIEGLSYEEASAQMGLPVGTVKSRANRAQKAMHALMESPKPRRVARVAASRRHAGSLQAVG